MNLAILDHSIRTVDGLYCLNDLHKASGGAKRHQPALFMRRDQTKSLIAEIQSTESQSAAKTINGGARRGTYVCIELVYAYAMWISAAFYLRVIRAYHAMVTSSDRLRKRLDAAELALKQATEHASECGRGLRFWQIDQPQLDAAVKQLTAELQLSLAL